MLTLCAVTERIAIFGASRGIGAAIVNEVRDSSLLLVSRRWSDNERPSSKKVTVDLADPNQWDAMLAELGSFSPTRLFYVAGGGPHGKYSDKEFKDHSWAYNLNLLTPARLLHWGARQPYLKQIIFFGSAVAESKADPQAASYSSAKHGLLGLVKTARGEMRDLDVRIYSPDYVATDLLPKSIQATLGDRILSPEEVAKDFIQWSNQGDGEFHRIFAPRQDRR